MKIPKRPKCLGCGHLIELVVVEAFARQGKQPVYCRACLLGDAFVQAQKHMLRGKRKVKS